LDELEQLLEQDYELGMFIKERLVPQAVLFFTGEAATFDDVRIIIIIYKICSFLSFSDIFSGVHRMSLDLTMMTTTMTMKTTMTT